MQKSKTFNLLLILVIFIYTVLAIKYMYHNTTVYLYIVNPIFWILVTIIVAIGVKLLYKKKFKREIINYALIAALVYIIIYIFFGIFTGFGKNPYSTTVVGIITNLWIFGTVIIAKEIIRYKIINNTYDKDKIKFGALIVIIYTLFEVGTTIFTINSEYSLPFIFKQTTLLVIPIIIKNILFTYIAINSNYIPCIIYELFTKAFLWIAPILPDPPWILIATINISIPAILFLYIKYVINRKEIFKKRKKSYEHISPRRDIVLISIVIILISFQFGIFPIKPISIATRFYGTKRKNR